MTLSRFGLLLLFQLVGAGGLQSAAIYHERIRVVYIIFHYAFNSFIAERGSAAVRCLPKTDCGPK